MNYTKHYDLLINRARNRTISGYTEKHHVVPSCLGGSNNKENMVSLTAREHYVAHQLLVKMNPDHYGLIKAANMMICKSANQERSKNRLYEWLRIKHSKIMSEAQTGSKNSQYRTCWISHIKNKQSIKIKRILLNEYISNGWIKKRIVNWNLDHNTIVCPNCKKEFAGVGKTCSPKCGQQLHNKLNPKEVLGGKTAELLKEYASGNSIHKCLINAGLCGTGKNHTILKRIIEA